MREVRKFDAPARARLTLQPNGPHLMFIGLKRPFAKGERIPLVLRFEKAGELHVELEVQAPDSRRAHH
jgi:copper(I)-binding protein